MARVKTEEARLALAGIIRQKVSEAAGTNTLVSRKEQAGLDPFLRERAERVREAGGPGARVTVDALSARAVADAAEVWDRFNPPGRGQDGKYLSQGELAAITRADPALGALSQAAYLQVRQAAAAPNAAEAVAAFFGGFHFAPDEATGLWPLYAPLPGGQLIDARDPAIRATLPPAVQESWSYYARAMEADWAGVRLQRAPIGGHDVYVTFATTDGDFAYLEVLSKTGAPLISGRLQAGALLGLDEVFGRARFSPNMAELDDPVHEEGLSEPPERAAAGQPPQDFRGDLQLDRGFLSYDPASYRLTQLDLPGLAGHPREEVAIAAFEYLWEKSLKHRILGSQDPFELGRLREGAMYVGEHRRNDGKVYEVASWRDIDDGSYVLYFDRTEAGRLRLASVQFDN